MSLRTSRRNGGVSLGELILNPDGLMSMIEASFYDKVDQQPIPANIRLQTGLNRYPSEWVDALCHTLKLPAVRIKKERLAAAAARLLQPDALSQVVTTLSHEEREALLQVLGAGGWIKYGTLSRRFGGEETDRYFWAEYPPTSVIGRLRLRGLLFVGRMGIGGRNWKVAVIPMDLRDLLKGLLGCR